MDTTASLDAWFNYEKEESVTQHLTLPLPPNRGNARQHWRVALQAKKAYWARLDALCWAKLVPKAPEVPPESVTLRTKMYVFSIMDHDNAVSRLKFPLDWLVNNGYLTDDKPKHMRLEMPEQFVDRKNPRLEITIEEEAA